MKCIVIPPKIKWDSLGQHFIEGLYDNGATIFSSDLSNGIKPEDVYSDDELIEHSEDADFIFYVFGNLLTGKNYLVKQINRPDITVYIDGSEWTYTAGVDSPTQQIEAKYNPARYRGDPWIHEEMYDFCRWYFKSACYPEDADRGIIPFPHGCHNEHFKMSNSVKDRQKRWDVYCSFGQIITGLRAELVELFSARCVNINIKLGKLDPNKYYEALVQSYIVPSAWGAQFWSMREWEILTSGSLCFMQRPLVLYSNHKPEDGVHWVEYSDMNEFQEKLNYYLNNKDLCVSVGAAGKELAEKYHTSKAKTKYILDIINER
jgi:hypothetical protein